MRENNSDAIGRKLQAFPEKQNNSHVCELIRFKGDRPPFGNGGFPANQAEAWLMGGPRRIPGEGLVDQVPPRERV
jgi:hypothetical protein